MKLIVSDTFRASYQKLAADRKRAVDRTIRKMAGDPVPPSLRIRRFESLDGVWIANVGKGDRILFVQRHLLQALEAAEAVGATQMVVHSPFNHWHHRNFGHQEGLKDQIIEASHATLGPAVRRAEQIGCELVIENIQDVDPLERVRLVESFGSAAVRVSFDTGHARMMSDMAGAPPIDYFVKCAGKLLHHVHLQDTDGYADRHWLPGDGCARHGHWIGGESPLRGELVATVSRRQLHVD